MCVYQQPHNQPPHDIQIQNTTTTTTTVAASPAVAAHASAYSLARDFAYDAFHGIRQTLAMGHMYVFVSGGVVY